MSQVRKQNALLLFIYFYFSSLNIQPKRSGLRRVSSATLELNKVNNMKMSADMEEMRDQTRKNIFKDGVSQHKQIFFSLQVHYIKPHY